MSDSLSHWLALREAADTAARSATLTRAIADALQLDRPVRILDLGTGTGSNVRYLSPRLPVPQQWLLVDRDPVLLAQSPTPTPGCQIETQRMELGTLDDPEIFSGRHLVTASALLDLVSQRWLRALAERCRERGAAALFALTYNGCSRCSPEEPEDGAILELFNRHQRTSDRGFGVAAGPDAVDAAAECFAAVGYRVRREPSDWILPADGKPIQRLLIEGWAEASLEIRPAEASMIQCWMSRRLEHVDAGRSRIVVCHEDLAAWLPSMQFIPKSSCVDVALSSQSL